MNTTKSKQINKATDEKEKRFGGYASYGEMIVAGAKNRNKKARKRGYVVFGSDATRL